MKRKLKKHLLILLMVGITCASLCYIFVQNPKFNDAEIIEMKDVAYKGKQVAESSNVNTATMEFGNYTCTITEKNKIKVVCEKGYIIWDFANDTQIIRQKNLKGGISFSIFFAIVFWGGLLVAILHIK